MSMTATESWPAAAVRPTSIIAGTLVTRDLGRTRRMCEGVLDLECVEPGPGRLVVREKGHRPGEARHGEPYWVLEISEVAEIDVPQEMLNHWGVSVGSQAAVDRAYEQVEAHKAEFGLGRVQKPRFRNGSYAFYFVDGDSNWWEVEYRTPDLVYEPLRLKGDQA
jgi:hypothetical protein